MKEASDRVKYVCNQFNILSACQYSCQLFVIRFLLTTAGYDVVSYDYVDMKLATNFIVGYWV